MKTLPPVKPTGEQLPIISDNSLGIEVIRGAAGSGKTSTAILRLRSLAYLFEERFERAHIDHPVEILVLTFNRTLSGYVSDLVDDQLTKLKNSNVTVNTFAKWAVGHLGGRAIVRDYEREDFIRVRAAGLPSISSSYAIKEVEYLTGRYLPEDLESYMNAERTGRGQEPRVERSLRRRILDEVVYPYKNWLNERKLQDWNDLAVEMAKTEYRLSYDIIIVDESQDFSANQLRAIKNHIAPEHAVTFVIDTMQRIYARGFTWIESGFDMRGARYHSLKDNHRNTAQIANLAAGVLDGLAPEDDGSLPDLNRAQTTGSIPVVLKGKFSAQLGWAINFIDEHVDLTQESVAFLSPQGSWFGETKKLLGSAGIAFEDITREPEWPGSDVNVALSTFHSAKGLEFDHVFILGLNGENTPHADADMDDQIVVLRRLLAVAIARARQTVCIGYKPGEESALIAYLRPGTFEEVVV